MTVETAYQQLVAEGYVNTQPKRLFCECFKFTRKKEAISVQLQKSVQNSMRKIKNGRQI